MEIKGVIFDLDGTLIDSYPLTTFAFKEVLKKWGNIELTEDEIYLSFGPPEKVIFKRYVGEDKLEECYLDYVKIFEKNSNDIKVFEGVREVLEELKRLEILTGIFTGRGRELSIKLLQLKELSQFFKELVSSENVPNPKPHPDGVKEICRRLGVKPSNCLHVGDSFMDIIAGKMAGAITAGALWGTRNLEKLLKEEPLFLLKSPEDILTIIKK